MLKTRLCDHRGYINNRVVNLPPGDHFNQPGHSQANLKVTRIEDESYQRERDKYFFNKFNTFYNGLNREKNSKKRVLVADQL